MIVGTDHPAYRKRLTGKTHYNGAFYYAKEIEKYFIPAIDTDRNWILLNQQGYCADHSIVFIHNNLHPELYDWLSEYDDLILVCGIPETVPKMKHLGKAVYLPLSVDVGYVEQFKCPKVFDTAFFGRRSKARKAGLPSGVDIVSGIKRQDFLPIMAMYKKVYAVGRTAIEAKILGCEVLPYDQRFPDPERWKIVDSKDAVRMLGEILDNS